MCIRFSLFPSPEHIWCTSKHKILLSFNGLLTRHLKNIFYESHRGLNIYMGLAGGCIWNESVSRSYAIKQRLRSTIWPASRSRKYLHDGDSSPENECDSRAFFDWPASTIQVQDESVTYVTGFCGGCAVMQHVNVPISRTTHGNSSFMLSNGWNFARLERAGNGFE